MTYEHLTPEQVAEITEVAHDMMVSDAMRDRAYLADIISNYIDDMTVAGKLDAISNDPDIYLELLTFDPKTGQKWSE